MKKKKNIILAVLITITIHLILRFLLNVCICVLYYRGFFAHYLIKPLYFLNLSEPYIVYYNSGNISYQKEDYKEAIESYNKALKKHPPKSRVCKIRVNLALATVESIQVTTANRLLNDLQKTREILYEDGCANELDHSGKDENAEKLDDVLQELEERYRNASYQDNNNSSSDDNDDSDEEDEDKELEQEILENKKNANLSRQDDLDYNEYMDSYKDFYSGKKW